MTNSFKPFMLSVLTLFVFILMSDAQTIRISEVMSDNGSTLLDEDSDSSDWIELYNVTDQPVDLNGWYLTDDDSDLTQWQLPATNLPAKAFLVIFASNKNRATAGSELHTNFKLSAAGDYVALVQTNGSSIEDGFTLPSLEEDTSYGYAFTNGTIVTTSVGIMTTPTPGAANSNITYLGNVEPPVTTPGRGFYDAPIQATVSNVTPGATIYYTLDGSEPTESSTLYSGPISISSTTNLRVRAFLPGWKPSYPRTDTYIYVEDVVLQPVSTETINGQDMKYGMDAGVRNKTYTDFSNVTFNVQDALRAIPSISITTDHDNLYSPAQGIYVNATERWERPASVELINPDGSDGFHMNSGLRIRGGWSRHPDFEKHAFRLFFRDIYGDGKLKFPLFEGEGVDEFAKMDLRTAQNYNWAQYNDARNNFLRDIFSRDSARAMGSAYTRSRYYHLYLNGLYWGLFMTEERPDGNFGESYLGGDEDDYDVIKVRAWDQPGAYSIEATAGTTNAYTRLYDAAMVGFTSNANYFAVQGLDANGAPDPTKEKLLDVENMIDYLLLIYYAGASDNGISAFRGNNELNNIYAIYNRLSPDGFKWVQHDCEHAFDTTTSIDRTGPYTHSKLSEARFFNAQTLHQKLSANDEYKIKFADRVYKHLRDDGALVRTNCEARLVSRARQIDRAIVANAARWGSTSRDRDTWYNALGSTYTFFSRSSDRCNEVIGYLDADGYIPSIEPPQINHVGGQVADGAQISITADAGIIYFTTDGSDPRAIGGAINGSAYSGPVSINAPTHIKARAYNGSEWSAIAQKSFWTPEVPLAFTEVMYHAPDGNPHDFVEIHNISVQTILLYGYKLDNAIDFKFKTGPVSLAPNEYMVVVDDLAAFSSTYPTSNIIIAGEYRGDLRNGSETIDLEFKGNDLITFTYSDARNWPQAADGSGHSLVPLDSAISAQEAGSLDYGGNWRASTLINGSPGYADPAPSSSVVLNEITAHTDTGLAPPFDSNDRIEIYNPTATPVVLNGWYLSDNLGDLQKWSIPNGTTVPAMGFIEFDEDDFHPGRTAGFGLNKAGEQVVLSTAGRVVDAIRFKGQENGVSFGRYPDGSTSWITTMPTPESTNIPAAVVLQLNEVMYHPLLPAGGEMEYIQIKNTSATTASFANPTGAYRIDGGVSFTFPSGLSLAVGEKLWLVSFDPAVDTNLLSQFRSTYGLGGSDPVYGPYKGRLSNRGERVALERPQASDDPMDPLDISWVVVDELFYFDQDPWPTSADGGGHPLIRTGLTSWDVPQTPGIGLSETNLFQRAAFQQTPSDSTFELWNSGLSNLNYSITTDVPWLAALPATGTSTGEHHTISLSYSTTALAIGSHTGQVSIAATNAFNTPRSVDVILDVYAPVLDHFTIGAIDTNQLLNTPFSVSISAIDQYNSLMESFTNSVSLAGLVGATSTPDINIGSGTSGWIYPMSTYYHDGRTQTIYLNSEMGSACTVTSLALNVSTLPGQALENWTIRMRHTSLSSYGGSPAWESDWTTVYQSNLTVSATGWNVFEFSNPFEYNGTNNIMIDFSHNNSSWTTDGQCVSSAAGASRSLYYRTDSGFGDPLTWSGTANPSPSSASTIPNIRLGCTVSSAISISPNTTGGFSAGSWSGGVTIHELATNAILHVYDGLGHSNYSNPFDVTVSDADGDGIPDAWESVFFGHPSNCVSTIDVDHDGHNNLQEYIAGTDPTNSASYFMIECLEQSGGFIVNWDPSVAERIYDVMQTTNLLDNFEVLSPSNYPPVNSYTDHVDYAESPSYYKVNVRLQP